MTCDDVSMCALMRSVHVFPIPTLSMLALYVDAKLLSTDRHTHTHTHKTSTVTLTCMDAES